MSPHRWTRRNVLLAGAALGSMPLAGITREQRMITRPIPQAGSSCP